ncbi:MAG: hypothetical protein UHX00_05365 [Caryophanon sp.]|nr:hypothetical protein [Caryophanon sp.]
MGRIETFLHVLMWSLLVMTVLHQFTANEPSLFLYANAIDIVVFFTVWMVALPFYRLVKRTMFGGATPLSRKGIASFLNVEVERVQQWHLPKVINGGDDAQDKLIVMWSYSFLLYFAAMTDVLRELLMWQDGEIEQQKFLIGLLAVGIVSFLLSWLFRLPRRKA